MVWEGRSPGEGSGRPGRGAWGEGTRSEQPDPNPREFGMAPEPGRSPRSWGDQSRPQLLGGRTRPKSPGGSRTRAQPKEPGDPTPISRKLGSNPNRRRARPDPNQSRGTDPNERRVRPEPNLTGGWDPTPIWAGRERARCTWQDREPSLSTMHSAFSWHGLISPLGQRRVPGAVWLLQPLI